MKETEKAKHDKQMSDQLQVLLDFIKKETRQKKGAWHKLIRSDIMTITGVHDGIASKLMYQLQAHPNIIFDLVLPKRGLGAYKYRWVDDPEEKIKYGLRHSQFSAITRKRQFTDIKNLFSGEDYHMQTNVLKFVNLLMVQKANIVWNKIDYKKWSVPLLLSEEDLKSLIIRLVDKQLLVISENHLKLTISKRDRAKANAEVRKGIAKTDSVLDKRYLERPTNTDSEDTEADCLLPAFEMLRATKNVSYVAQEKVLDTLNIDILLQEAKKVQTTQTHIIKALKFYKSLKIPLILQENQLLREQLQAVKENKNFVVKNNQINLDTADSPAKLKCELSIARSEINRLREEIAELTKER